MGTDILDLINNGIIFIGGIHGVGKSTFAKYLSSKTGLAHTSCSKIIEDTRKIRFSQNKVSEHVEKHQEELVNAVNCLKDTLGDFILDGHFCLRSQDGTITPIGHETFQGLNPKIIILIEAKASDILDRRPEMNMTAEEINNFMAQERKQAECVARKLQIPMYQAVSRDCGTTYEITRIPN